MTVRYFATIALAMSVPLAGQWLKYPTPGIPRTADGKPNLTAPTPKLSDGKPDLSGVWQIDGLGFAFNITGNQKTDNMLPSAQALYKQRSETYSQGDPNANCLPAGPRTGLFSQELLKIIHTPPLAAILYEEGPHRQIFIDGRPLPKDPNPAWMGYSIGRWEGDTLVIDSAGFNDRTWLDIAGHPHSEALHVTERFTRKDFGHMQLDMTFDDPKTYLKPWTITMGVNFIPDTDLLEYVCNENEKDRPHMIGKQQDEREKEVKVAREILSKYVGSYRAGPVGILRISLDGDQLAVELPGGGGKLPVFAQSETEFFLPTLGSGVEFVKDSKGAVTRLMLRTVEGNNEAVRVP
jgi:hypothetical protein